MKKPTQRPYLHSLILGLLWTLASAFPTPPSITIDSNPPYYYTAFGAPFPWLGFQIHRGIFTFYKDWLLMWIPLNYLFWTGIFYAHFSTKKRISNILGLIGLIISAIFTMLATTTPITIFYYVILIFSIRYIKLEPRQ